MKKNYGPKTIAFFCAIVTFGFVFLTNFIFFKKFYTSLIAATFLFLFVYVIVLYYIKEILDKKIQSIYKFINQTKAGKREKFYQQNLLPRPSLMDVGKDVEEWANKNEAAFELLEKNEQYRKEFLQNLSHELKTPLFSMQGYVESLLNGALYDNKVNEKFLKNTSNNVNRLLDLANDLDAITKLENQTENLNISTFSISDLINEVFDSIVLKAKERHISLGFKNGSLQNKKVIADKAKIAQVLLNLVENAIKYGKANGYVLANIDELSDGTIMIEMDDNGYGIAEEHLHRIFERFYRTDTARARKVGGSGLGLAICKHIIEAHNQSIHVRSKHNEGTTFWFTLKKGN